MNHALLVRPAANRVFAGDAARLLQAELEFLAGSTVTDLGRTSIAGIEYVTFGGDVPVDVVARLSSAFALFGRDGDLLRPVALPPVERFDDDLVTTQRYVGKTNETLTKLLLNVALRAADQLPEQARVLDPLCGRGTTLNQALRFGSHALGIDVDAKDTAAYAMFLRTWLQDKKLKHQVDAAAGRHRFRLEIGRKGAGDEPRQIVDVVTGDTVDVVAAFGRGRTDVIVTDLPYGVQHGSRAAGALARRPDQLLAVALPAWRAALRPGGGVGLSWNSRSLSRVDLVAILAEHDLEVLAAGEGGEFSTASTARSPAT